MKNLGWALKQLSNYSGIGGDEPPKKNVYTSQQQIDRDNAWARNLLARQNAPGFLVNNSVVARKVGDPIPQFVVQGTPPLTPNNRKTDLPKGVTVDDIINDNGNYGYIDPVYGAFVAVDPQAIYSKYKSKK